MNKKTSTKPVSAKDIQRKWILVDAKDQILGRIATQVAVSLMGKDKRNYVLYLDLGDYVVIVNAEQVKVTGKKEEAKTYERFSGYPGGLDTETLRELRARKPDDIIRSAISGMLPKNKLRDRRLARLFIYRDEQHPYQDKVK